VDWQQGSTVPALYIPDTYSSCHFICYSYKNFTNTLPDYTGVSSLPALSVRDGGSNELLLWRSPSAVAISGDGSVGPVTLTRQLTQVKLELISNEKKITGVANTITLSSAVPVNTSTAYNFSTGAVTTGTYSSTDLSFIWPTISPSGVSTVTSDPLLLIPQTGFTLTIPAGAITMETGVTQNTLTTIPFSNALEAGKIHTIRVKLRGPAKFASSNIYWDGSKLTFDPYSSSPSSTTSPQKQGVLFKWGSLIGISAPGKDQTRYYSWNDTATIYVPLTPNNPTTNHTSWEKTTTTSAQSRWTLSGTGYAGIPYVASNEHPGPSGDRTDSYLTTTLHSSTSTAAYKGDICQYINSAYRMPRSEEFPDYSTSIWVGRDNIPAYGTPANHLPSVIDGTTSISSPNGVTLATATTGTGLFFPASGCRLTDGTLYYVGAFGYYWSSSAYSTDAYYLYFCRGNLSTADGNMRLYGFSVRCVLQ
jgi:hypothetical protein